MNSKHPWALTWYGNLYPDEGSLGARLYMQDSLIGGDVLVAVLTHSYGDLEAHGGIGGLAVTALAAQSSAAATAVVLGWT